MKIVAISDTHGNQKWHEKIDECDILIHSGDISPMRDHSSVYQIDWLWKEFIPQLQKIPAKNIIFIGGNHDFGLQKLFITDKEEDFRKNLPANIHYLRDSGIEIEGIKFWGTPWVVRLDNWAFNRNDTQSESVPSVYEYFSKIPKGLDILISHGPASGYSDIILEYGSFEHLGSEILFQEIKRACPKWVLTGHIHSANHRIQKTIVGESEIKFVCTSLLDESYLLNYDPFKLEI